MANRLAMSNTLVADNGGNGIVIRPTGTDKSVSAVLNHVETYQNSGAGVVADGSSSSPTNLLPAIIFVTVTASVSANNGASGFVAGSLANHSAVEMHLTGSVSARNSHFGIEITPAQTLVWLAQSTVVGKSQPRCRARE